MDDVAPDRAGARFARGMARYALLAGCILLAPIPGRRLVSTVPARTQLIERVLFQAGSLERGHAARDRRAPWATQRVPRRGKPALTEYAPADDTRGPAGRRRSQDRMRPAISSLLTHHSSLTDWLWTALAPALTPVSGWTLRGVALAPDGTLRLAPSGAPTACSPDSDDGGVAAFDPIAGLCAGHDPHRPGRYDGGDYYNGSRFHFGTALSPPLAAPALFQQAIASWVSATPVDTWIEVHLRVRLASGAWTRWYAMPIWTSSVGTIKRHSVEGQGGAATIDTDTLELRPGRAASTFQLAVTLFTTSAASPEVRRLSLAASGPTPADPPPAVPGPAWGIDLAVPGRSQMLARYRGAAYGGGGEVWCSPTATAMLLAYWARRLGRPGLAVSVPAAARGTYDWTYAGTGNWPFNVAYATSFAAMDGFVARFPSLAALEPWIADGVPLALSIAFAPGALPDAPIPSSAGHLLVLRGFDRAGNPIVDDPAGATDATVRRVYPRAALERAWLDGSQGTTYVIFPRNWPTSPTEV